MVEESDSPKLSVLHVLTLNGRNGEYGGPVRVARELCAKLNSRGHVTHIFSGAVKGSEPIAKPGLSESFILVKPISKKFDVSSLWNWKLIGSLNKLIKNADIVHIHFAREIVPFSAVFLAILKRKPFVTQTHGMIVSDGRISTRVIDFFLTKPLINRSGTNLVLTETEMLSLKNLRVRSPLRILPNGITVDFTNNFAESTFDRIVFCSRLDKRKGIDKFIELASLFRESGLLFEIYGPDGGELNFALKEITSRNLENILQYKGSLQSSQVQDVLRKSKLLVLPSENEPFPMIVLESLSVGTPVLVMPSCGISRVLANFDSKFVAPTEDVLGLRKIMQLQIETSFKIPPDREIREFCNEKFGIQSVVTSLSKIYREVHLSV